MSRTSRPLTRIAALGTGLALAALPFAAFAGTAGATTTTTTPKAKTCSTGALPSSVVGKPTAFKAGLPAGAWLWHDGSGWHLRVTHDNKHRLTFTGTIHSSGHVTAQRYKLESNDHVARNKKHTTVSFVFRNYGGVDGVNFQVGCAKDVTVSVKAAGKALGTSTIHLGATQANPTSNPFVVERS